MTYLFYTHFTNRSNKLMDNMLDLEVVSDHFVWRYNYIQNRKVAVWLSLVTNNLVHERSN